MEHEFYKKGFEGILNSSREISHDEYLAEAENFIRDNEETDDLEPNEIEGFRINMRRLAQEIFHEKH